MYEDAYLEMAYEDRYVSQEPMQESEWYGDEYDAYADGIIDDEELDEIEAEYFAPLDTDALDNPTYLPIDNMNDYDGFI